jgi:hypothetical protein
LQPWLDQIDQAVQSGDWLQQMTCLWNVAHDVVDSFRDIPGLTIRRYEDLAREPMTGFESLYDWFDLDWSAKAQQVISEATSPSVPAADKQGFSWNLRGGLSRTAFQPMDSKAAVAASAGRLSAGEIDEVRERTATIASRFSITD